MYLINVFIWGSPGFGSDQPTGLGQAWGLLHIVTQVFPYGKAEFMLLEKESFKVNAQRLKPYFGGEFQASKQAINLRTPKCVVGSSCSPIVSGTLRFMEFELTTLNKALLGRQPKHFQVFHSLV